MRGGYGASRLLESIDWQGLAQRQQQDPLLICGHSDFTVIQLGLLALHNVITFSGPMLAGNFGAPELDAFTMEHFWRALRNPAYSVEWQGNGPHWECEGQLWGGNTAMLVSLIGTPWMPDIEDGILVLEDINEHPFRVERMLLQLYHAGILARQSAIVLGSFSGAAPMTMTRATRWKPWSISFAPGWTFPSSPGWISAMSSKPSLLRWGRTRG